MSSSIIRSNNYHNIDKNNKKYYNNNNKKRSVSPDSAIDYNDSKRQCSSSRDLYALTPLSSYSFESFSSSNTINSSNYSSAKSINPTTNRLFTDLPLEFWERSERCKEAKLRHMDKIDNLIDREELVLLTTLYNKNILLEPNMFPYLTPSCIEHFTLWSRRDLTHKEIVKYVDDWLIKNLPHVRRWQYDDNCGDRSINLFHVHVFIETQPYAFVPRDNYEYFPPHLINERKLHS